MLGIENPWMSCIDQISGRLNMQSTVISLAFQAAPQSRWEFSLSNTKSNFCLRSAISFKIVASVDCRNASKQYMISVQRSYPKMDKYIAYLSSWEHLDQLLKRHPRNLWSSTIWIIYCRVPILYWTFSIFVASKPTFDPSVLVFAARGGLVESNGCEWNQEDQRHDETIEL